MFHLAALIAIPYSYVAPESFVDTNVGGTLNVLEAAGAPASGASSTPRPARSTARPRRCRSARRTRSTPSRRTRRPRSRPTSSRSRSSGSFGLPVVVLRPFNTYGPRQSERAVLPTMLRQLLAGQREIRLGRLDTRRDLTFVADTVDGFVRAADGRRASTGGRSSSAPAGREIDRRGVRRSPAGCSASDADGRRGRGAPAAGRQRGAGPPVGPVARRASCSAGRAATALEDGLAATIEWLRDASPTASRDATRVQL